jgi:hypothetical protein
MLRENRTNRDVVSRNITAVASSHLKYIGNNASVNRIELSKTVLIIVAVSYISVFIALSLLRINTGLLQYGIKVQFVQSTNSTVVKRARREEENE